MKARGRERDGGMSNADYGAAPPAQNFTFCQRRNGSYL